MFEITPASYGYSYYGSEGRFKENSKAFETEKILSTKLKDSEIVCHWKVYNFSL